MEGSQKRIFYKKLLKKESILKKNHIFISMEEKLCSGCKRLLQIFNFYPNKRYSDGYNCHCKECVKEAANQSKLRNKERWYNADGYINEKEHFNAALEQYAEVFNLPSLLRYKRK